MQLVNPVLGQLLGQGGREMQQFVRTTCGVVGLHAGGVAQNVLPRAGTITLNCRPLPGARACGAQASLHQQLLGPGAEASMPATCLTACKPMLERS